MRREPRPHEIFTHFKGNKYQILALATHSETGEKYVVYQAMYGDFTNYVRPYDLFMGEVDHDKYPEVKQLYRFYRDDEADELYVLPSVMEGDSITAENAEWNLDPLVEAFLEADSHHERLNILVQLYPRITDDMINTMAVAIDVEIDDGPIDKRYDELKMCILTREKYERSRFS